MQQTLMNESYPKYLVKYLSYLKEWAKLQLML